MRAPARTVQIELVEYTDEELRAAHAELLAQHRLAVPFAVAMAHPCYRVFVRCRAHDIRNREAARRRGSYVPAHATSVWQTIQRARLELSAHAQQELSL